MKAGKGASVFLIWVCLMINPLIVSGDQLEELPKQKAEVNGVEVIPTKAAIKGKLENILEQKEAQPIECIPNDVYPVSWGNCELNLEEFKLLCITTWCESGNQDLKTQTLVAKTILNRIASELFPNNLHDVVYQTNQYSVVKWAGFPVAYADKVTEQVEQACIEAILTDSTPHDMFYFRNSYYHGGRKAYYNNGVLFFSRQ